MSDFVEISVWVPDDDAEFDETEDIYTWSNFEEDVDGEDAEGASIDLSSIEYAWLEIDPDGQSVFANTHILLYGGRNYAYTQYVHHQSSSVNFGAVNETGGATWGNFTVPDGDTDANIPYGMASHFAEPPTGTSGLIDENITLTMDVPRFNSTNLHVGTNWDVEQSEYNDMSTSEVLYTHDEGNWRDQSPVYIPADDLEKDGGDGLESVTNAFAIRWTYNTTVSTTDGAVTQVNMTLAESYGAEVVIDGTHIYIIWYETISFEDGLVAIEFEYQEESDIYATAVDCGRLNVPRDEDALGTYTQFASFSPIGM